MTTLDQLEARLKALLEVKLVQSLPGYTTKDRLAQLLASAMHSNLRQEDILKLAPNIYVVVANPYTLARWKLEPLLLDELARIVFLAGEESGFTFPLRPSITTAADAGMLPDTIRILASFSAKVREATHDMAAEKATEPAPIRIPRNAFLILGGTKIIPLDQPVMNIGRRLDNQVVIDDPRVSRNHAQLRIVKDRFVIFDLNSSGGLYVNGHRTNQSVLYPGDVISLAGVNLLFGHDLDTRRLQGSNTQPGLAISADRPTAILRPDHDK